MLRAWNILANWLRLHWKPVAGIGSLAAILAGGQKIMALAKSFYETVKARWEAREAKARYVQSERQLLGIAKPTPRVQRTLTIQQRTIIIETIKGQMRNDPPKPAWRTVRVTTFPIEDCQSLTHELANALGLTNLHVHTRFDGMDTAEENSLYQKGIWVRGREPSDPYFQPPTQDMILQSLEKAGIQATYVPSDTAVEIIVGTA